MKNTQPRNEWLKKEKSQKTEWLIKTTFPSAHDYYSLSIYLNQITDEEFLRVKNRWNSYIHRADKKTISCVISKSTHRKLKILQGKNSLTKTLEEIIEINHEAREYYKKIFKEKLSAIKKITEHNVCHSFKEPDKSLEMNYTLQEEVAETRKTLAKQEIIISALQSIVTIMSDELTDKGLKVSEDRKYLILEYLDIAGR